MKPAGRIPPGFEALDGELAIGGVRASELIRQAGDTPLFVYDMARVRAQVTRLRTALPAVVAIHYAIKANPFAPLVRTMAGIVDGFDIASAGELEIALAAGASGDRISFAGPGKRDDELASAIAAGATINLESEKLEATRALAIAGQAGITPRLAVRINPGFELRGSGMKMGGRPTPFGIDEDRVAPLVRRLLAGGADWRGLHIFAGSQSLDAAAIIEAQVASIALASRIAEEAGAGPPLVNLGGGFGIPYFAGDEPLDIEAIGAALGGALDRRPGALADTGFAIELGRWLVGEAGVYLSRIVDRKQSHGSTFLVIDGGMHHQLGASGNLGMMVRRNYPVAIAPHFGGTEPEMVNIVGRLCTPLDRIADDVMLPRSEIGDLVAVFLAGAYALTASPSAFLGHRLPQELLLDGVAGPIS